MKKITTVIAITLLAALLFTGCDFIPMEKDFSMYGFKFTIAGEVTDDADNTEGLATFETKYGTMTFTKMLLDLGLTEGSIAKSCEAKEKVGENGTVYYFAPETDKDGNSFVKTYYFVKDANDTTWQVTLVTPEADYNKLMVTNVYKSIEFVNAE